MNEDNTTLKKSYLLAVKSVKLGYSIQSSKKEFILSKQFIRSATSTGAMTREAQHAESKADFIHKMSIALKEAKETQYWLDLLKDSEIITEKEWKELHSLLIENISMLAA